MFGGRKKFPSRKLFGGSVAAAERARGGGGGGSGDVAGGGKLVGDGEYLRDCVGGARKAVRNFLQQFVVLAPAWWAPTTQALFLLLMPRGRAGRRATHRRRLPPGLGCEAVSGVARAGLPPPENSLPPSTPLKGKGGH